MTIATITTLDKGIERASRGEGEQVSPSHSSIYILCLSGTLTQSSYNYVEYRDL